MTMQGRPRHEDHDGLPSPAVADATSGAGKGQPADDHAGQRHQGGHGAHDSPGGQGVCIDGGRLGHDGRGRGCREPEPIEQGGGVGGRQVADGHEVQGLGKVLEYPS
jgi:hypothetical protein